jgi:hypothetical protein
MMVTCHVWLRNAPSAERSLDGWVAAFGLPYNYSRWAFGAVGTALRRRATKKNCEDCGVTVAGGAAIHSGGPQGGLHGPLGLPVPNNSPGPQYAQYIESRLRGT